MSLPADPVGSILLGKYRVLERIGMGGMAEVFHGRHEKLNRDVAIKIMHSALTEDPLFIARFEREARLAATLRHSGIVQVYDFDTQGDHLFMVMEYINGGTLKQRLESLKSSGEFLPLHEASRIFSQIANALDYAHSRNMLHRDLKPSNILIDRANTVYLTDFGIARSMGSSEITRTGSILGTPAYMSPEQCEGKSLSFSSDLYSLGIILFEMLTNTVPFEAESPLAVLHKQIHDLPPNLDAYRPDLPAGINELLQQALSKEPGKRFSTAAGFAKSFAVLIKDAASGNPSSQSLERGPIETGENTPNKEMAKAAPNKSRGWLLAVGLVTLILLTAGILIWTARQSSTAAIRRCTTPAACQTAALQLVAANRLVLAAEAYVKASSLVPGGEQTTWAKMKCDLGDIYLRINKTIEARNAYRDCIAWTHNEGQWTNIRQYAQQKLKELK
jgi:serine/threonine protein kinase